MKDFNPFFNSIERNDNKYYKTTSFPMQKYTLVELITEDQYNLYAEYLEKFYIDYSK